MANTIIQLKKSGLVGNTPSSLNYGELALNYADGKLFYKNSLGSIVSLTAGLASYSFSTINASSTLILAGSSSDTLSFAGANGVTITGNTSTKTVTVGLNTSSITANLSNYQSVTNATTGTWYPALYNGTSGNRQVNANNALSFNSATGALSATSFNASGITQSTFTDSSGVSTSNQTLKIGNGTNWLAFQANASGGSYNGITTTGDVALWFSNGSGTSSSTPGNLIIAPWAGFNFGLRLNSAANTVAITGSITSTANITASSGTVSAANFSGATLLLDSLYLLDANTFTTSSTAQVSVDSFASATYRSAKYQAQITSGSSYHVIELLLVHNGTTVYLSQYGEIFTGVSLGTFDATITTGTLNLLFTPTNAITTIKVAKNLITV